jgi:GxxExxY protein
MQELIDQDKTRQIIGICMEIHQILGHGFSEIVYKDAIQYELFSRNIHYEREKEYLVSYKNIILTHKFYADFVVFNNIILEIKAAESGLCGEFTSMLINYLKVSGCKVGLLVNFGRKSLEFKRLVY